MNALPLRSLIPIIAFDVVITVSLQWRSVQTFAYRI
jgi:hypothetical protein